MDEDLDGYSKWSRARRVDIQKLLTVVIRCSTMIPFRWISGRYCCFYCSQIFTECSKLQSHTTQHDKDNLSLLKNTTSKRFKLDVSAANCRICGTKVEDLNDFLNHLQDKHIMLKFNRQASDSFTCFKLSDDVLRCTECEETFRFFGPLLIHYYRTHGSYKYICETCGLNFVDRNNMLAHMTVHKKSVKKIKHLVCTECFQVFRCSYSLSKHLAMDHNIRSKQYVCDECGYMCVYKNRLLSHQIRVHNKDEAFKCNVCGFTTYKQESLSRHMTKHVDEKPFQCEYCSKTFQRKKYLVVHTRIHTNERPYACQYCEKAFAQVASLKSHYKYHHPEHE